MGVIDGKNKILTFTDKDSVGGQVFNKFPETPAEVAQFWSEAWFETVKDLIVPPIVVPPAASKAAFAATMQPIVSVPGGGIAAMSAAAVAAVPALAASIAPNLILAPPPSPFVAVLAGVMAPFIIAGIADPVAPALAWATAVQTWLATGQWTTPGPPAPQPFQVGP